MTLFELARKSILRSAEKFMPGTLSCALSVLFYFELCVMLNHPVQSVGNSLTPGVVNLLTIAKVVLAVFSLIYFFYTVRRFFIHRKAGARALLLSGGSRREIRWVYFIEIMLCAMFALGLGLVFGMLFSGLFLQLGQYFFANGDYHAYLPVGALIETALSYTAAFVAVAFAVPVSLPKKLWDVGSRVSFNAEKEFDSREMTARFTQFFIATTVAIGFSLMGSSDEAINTALQWAMSAAWVVSAYLGARFLWSWLVWFKLRTARKNGGYFVGTDLLSLSRLACESRSFVQRMTWNSVLYAASIGCMVLMLTLSINAMAVAQNTVPYAVIYSSAQSRAQTSADLARIERTLKPLPGFRKTELKLSRLSFSVGVISLSEVNAIREYLSAEPFSLGSDAECVVITDYKDSPVEEAPELAAQAALLEGIRLRVTGSSNEGILLSGCFDYIVVVSDALAERIAARAGEETYYIFDYDNWQNLPEISETLMGYFSEKTSDGDVRLSLAYRYYTSERWSAGVMLFMGGMLSAAFEAAALNVVYSGLFGDLDEECDRLKKAMRIGMKRSEASRAMGLRLRWLLQYPFVLALVLTLAFMAAIEQYFYSPNLRVAALCSAALLAVHSALYFAIRSVYLRRIVQEVYAA